jgi:hypothetical protein
VKHLMFLSKRGRKRKLWPFVTAAAVVVGGSTVQLSRRWLEREKMSFLWDWNWVSGRPVLDNLADCLHCDWGGAFSIIEHPNDKEGDVIITYQRWIVGPFTLQRVDYQRPGTHYD